MVRACVEEANDYSVIASEFDVVGRGAGCDGLTVAVEPYTEESAHGVTKTLFGWPLSDPNADAVGVLN